MQKERHKSHYGCGSSAPALQTRKETVIAAAPARVWVKGGRKRGRVGRSGSRHGRMEGQAQLYVTGSQGIATQLMKRDTAGKAVRWQRMGEDGREINRRVLGLTDGERTRKARAGGPKHTAV